MSEAAIAINGETRSWWEAIKPYFEKAPIAAFFVGVSSGFPYAMIGATLTTRLAQDGNRMSGSWCEGRKLGFDL